MNITDISKDPLQHILLQLHFKDIKNICIVNKLFRGICSQEYFWTLLLQRDFNEEESKFKYLNLTQKHLYELLHNLNIVKTELKRKESLYHLYNLQSLNLFYTDLHYLKHLNLVGNQLTSIPKEIGVLVNLKHLNLSGNQLTSIPIEIGNLLNLSSLDLSDNQLTSIPKEIGNLSNLVIISLSNNQLTSIPKEIKNLPKLIRLYLTDNPISKEVLNDLRKTGVSIIMNSLII